MKTYFIDKINNKAVKMTANSVNEMESAVLNYCFLNGFDTRKVYVHCSNVCSGTTDEQNVEYIIRTNDNTHTITTRRI